jgi:hypothetical protein
MAKVVECLPCSTSTSAKGREGGREGGRKKSLSHYKIEEPEFPHSKT